MKLKRRIFVTAQFVGFHRWKNAPEEVAFLRSFHRHLFHVKVFFDVSHGDRDLEFFQEKEKVDDFLKRSFSGAQFDGSCEFIAEKILAAIPYAVACEVSEDGENGAIVCYE